MEQNPIPDQTSAVSEQPLGTRVTLCRCLYSLLFTAVWVVFSGTNALICISKNDTRFALMNLLLVLVGSFVLWLGWKQYRLVKSGVPVYIQRNLLRMPIAVSVVITGILTLFVMLVTVVCAIFIATPYFRHNLLVSLAIVMVVSGLLWGYVAYCWYRIHQERQQSKPKEVLAVPTEGVWPPPPIR